MTVSQLIASFLANEITYADMTSEQQAAFDLYASQGGFQGASS